MDATAVREGLYAEIRNVLGTDVELGPEMSAKDVPGWNSLSHVMILIGVEERFGIKLSSREMDAIENIGDLLTILNRRLQGAAG